MIRFSFSSLRVRLIFLIILAVIPALGLILYTSSEQRRHVVIEVEKDLLQLTKLIAFQEEELIGASHQLLIALANLPQMRSNNSAICNSYFADLLERYKRYVNFGVISRNGDLVCSGLPFRGPINLSDRSYFQGAIKNRDFTIGEYQIGRITGKPTVNFGYPVFDKTGQVKSVVFAALDLDWLNRFELEVMRRLPQGATITKMDFNSRVVLVHHPNPEKWVGKPLPETELIKKVLKQNQGVIEAIGLEDIPGIFAFMPMVSKVYCRDIHLIVGIPQKIAYAKANRTLIRNLIGLGLITFFALLVAWFGTNAFILRQLSGLMSTTKKIAAGDLSARTGPTYGQGELDQLANAFDEMAEDLEQHEAERKRAEEKIYAYQKQLRSLASELSLTEERERRRIATDLHDHIGQTLALAQIKLGVLQKLASATDLVGPVDEIRELIEQTIQYIRSLTFELSPPILYELGLEAALEWLAERTQEKHGILIDFEDDRQPKPMSEESRISLFKSVRELLTNIVKHAQTHKAKISIQREGNNIQILVEDDGVGFSPPEDKLLGKIGGYGLFSIRERLKHLGGLIEIESKPGQGTRVTLVAPLEHDTSKSQG